MYIFHLFLGPPLSYFGGSDSKASVYNARDLGSSPGLGRSPGEGNGNPLQYYCLENPMDRGAWWAAVHGVAKSQTWLSDFTFTLSYFKWYLLENVYCIYIKIQLILSNSTFAWKIPWTEEPDRLPSMGLHRVWHYLSDLANRTYIGLAKIFLWIFSKDVMEKPKQTFWPTHTVMSSATAFLYNLCSFNFFLLSLDKTFNIEHTKNAKNGYCEHILPVTWHTKKLLAFFFNI